MTGLGRFCSVDDAAALPGADWLCRRRVAAAEALRTSELPSEAEEVWRYSPVGEIDLGDYRLTDFGSEAQPSVSDLPQRMSERFGLIGGLVVVRNGAVVHVEVTPEAAAAGLEVASLAEGVGRPNSDAVSTPADAASAASVPAASAPVADAASVPAASAPVASAASPVAPSAAAADPGLGSVLAAADDLPDAFVLLNDALSAAPIHIHIPQGVRITSPVVVAHILDAEAAAVFPRLLVTVGEGAEARIVDLYTSDDSSTFAAPVVEIKLGAGANLGYLSIQELGYHTTAVASTAAVVDAQAHLSMGLVAVGGSYARLRTDCSLAGRGSTGDISAMYFADRRQVHDFRTFQNHDAPDTNSNLLFVGAVDDEARSIYSGLIRVGPEARGTDAVQTNRILKLAEDVWAESVPNLEIENNDVRCAHATSVGPLDEAQRFYLESRGVPPDMAERLIVEGYFGEVARRLPVQELAEALGGLVSAKLTPHGQADASREQAGTPHGQADASRGRAGAPYEQAGA